MCMGEMHGSPSVKSACSPECTGEASLGVGPAAAGHSRWLDSVLGTLLHLPM